MSQTAKLWVTAILLCEAWVFVACAWAACALTGQAFPGLTRLHRIASLPAVTLAVALVLFAALKAAAVWLWWSWRSTRRDRSSGGGFKDMGRRRALARARRILGDALVGGDAGRPDGDLVRFIGCLGRLRLYAQMEDSELVVCQTRGGKTRSVVARRVIEAPGPVLATSTKPDGVYLTWLARLRAKGGRILSFDPQGVAHGPAPIRWDPVAGCEDFDTARERGVALAMGATKSMGSGNSRWFAERGAQILGYFFHAAALAGLDIMSVQEWVGDPRQAIAILRDAGGPTTARMAAALQDLMVDMASETASGFKGTMQGALEPLLIPSVHAALTPPAEESFRAEDFLDSADVVWVLSPDSEGALAAVTTMFVDYVYQAARRSSARKPGSRHVPAVSFVLDEAANVAPLPQLASMFSEGSGRGLFTCAVFQDYAQIEHRWGRTEARTVFQQARLVYVMGSSKDTEWNRRIASLSDEFEERRESVSVSRDGTSVSSHKEHRHALRASDIANIRAGRAVLLAPGHDAALIDLTDIAADPEWGPLVEEGSKEYNTRLRRQASGADDEDEQEDEGWMNRIR